MNMGVDVIKQYEAEQIEKATAKKTKPIPEFRTGDTLTVATKVTEGSRTRIQNFTGLVISKQSRGLGGTNFRLRKNSSNIGVEKVFPIYSPLIESITVERRGKSRRATLYNQRNLQGKAARIAEDRRRK
jgi:large subunit ribosomal protein L19